MRAVRLTSGNRTLSSPRSRVPEPRGSEVLVEVGAAGLCRSDIHIMSAPPGAYPYTLPFTLGHETAGRVAALGPGASGVEVGDASSCTAGGAAGRVGSAPTGATTPARAPSAVLTAEDSVATAGSRSTSSSRRRGTWCRPPGLDPVAAAPLTDAALTSYHAAKLSLAQLRPGTHRARPRRGRARAPGGPDSQGHQPGRIVAVDVRNAALELARTAGADAVLSADGLTPDDVRAETGPDGATVVLDFVGNDATLALAAGSVAQGGDVTFVGRGGGELRVAPGLIPYESTVRMPTWGTRARARRGGGARQRRRDPLRGRGVRPRRRASARTAGSGTGTCSDARSSSRAAVRRPARLN